MAAVLEKLMIGEVTPIEVVDWLLQKSTATSEPAEGTNSVLNSLSHVRSSFVQHFINHLRTQTMQLTLCGNTIFASPAGKTNRLFKALREQKLGAKTPASLRGSHRTKVNLFQSPATSDISDVEASFSSLDMSGSFTERGHSRKKTKDSTSLSSSEGDVLLSRSFERVAHHNTSNPKSRRKNKKSQSFIVRRVAPERCDRSLHNVSAPDPICNFSLDSPSDFPSIGSSDSFSLTPRRITPTAVSTPLTTSSQNSGFGERAPWSHLPETEITKPLGTAKTPTLEAERSMLRRLRLGEDSIIRAGNGCIPQSPGEKPKNLSFCDFNQVNPELNKVTCYHQLEVAIYLYSRLLREPLVPNVWMELYFLFQLLTVRGSGNDHPRRDDDHYLSTVHNAVYFAVEVLNQQRRYFALMDKATLKLLVDSDVIQHFKPSFQQELVGYLENSTYNLSVSVKHASMLSAVPFHVETDNRENFPSDRSFHSFKKQRDKFYELLREWQFHHSQPGWSMHGSMANRIRDLVSIASDTANSYHFAKLFTLQLIRMCQEDPHQSTDAPEALLLNHLKMENPDKLRRLEERFTTPSAVVGPCPPPQFEGCQEFFRNFIIEADCYTLNHHLMDCISARIKELNKFSYSAEHREVPSQLIPDKEQREQFLACLQTLRILAKFFGLIKFLPYKQSNEKLTGKLREEIMVGREKVQHQLDVVGCVRAGYKNRRLILVIPWLVEFLSMMDSEATAMEYYSTAIRCIGSIYRIVGTSEPDEYPLGNQFLLLLLIGWLFEVQCLTPDLSSRTTILHREESDDITEPPLDHIPLVDQALLYSCCPYLNDVKGLLSEAAVTSPMRKITPVAADVITQPTNRIPEFLTAQVQLDLERNFFHTQSQSLKKSVDFVASRVASNCIKHIDAVLLMNERKALAAQMMALFQQTSSNTEGDGGEFKKAAQEAMNQACRLTMTEADRSAQVFVGKKCRVIIRHILTEDASTQLLRTVWGIAVRNSLQRVQKWIYLQIPGAFKQELESTLRRCLKLHTAKSEITDEFTRIPADPQGSCMTVPSQLLQELKDAVLSLLVSPERATLVNDLTELISKTKSVLLCRQDLTQTTLSSIEHLVKELFTLACVISPKSIIMPKQGPGTSPSIATSPTQISPPGEGVPFIEPTVSTPGRFIGAIPPTDTEQSTRIIVHPLSDTGGFANIPASYQTAEGDSPHDAIPTAGKSEVGVCLCESPNSDGVIPHAEQSGFQTGDIQTKCSVGENNNSECTPASRCDIHTCMSAARRPVVAQGELTLLHQFVQLLQDQLGCKLSPESFFSARSEVIAGPPSSDVLQIYSCINQMMNEEVT